MPKKVDLFVYVHPEDFERGRTQFPDMFWDDPRYLVVKYEEVPRNRIILSSLDLLEDKADWKDYGGLEIE